MMRLKGEEQMETGTSGDSRGEIYSNHRKRDNLEEDREVRIGLEKYQKAKA